MDLRKHGLQRDKARERRGQALVEVAVFGTIFLMIIGALVTYGLRFDYNQRAQQQAFRRALKIASDQDLGGGMYMLIEDRYIPDPTDPFGIGTSMPVVASAEIIRTHQLDARAGGGADPNDLPTVVMDVQLGWTNDPTQPPVMQRYIYRNAGFRYERKASGYTEDDIDKYMYIYGDVRKQEEYQHVIGTGPWGIPLTQARWRRVRIIDACSGHMVDYNTCYEQATMLVDEDYCYATCRRNSKDTDVDCSAICGRVLNPPNQNDQSTFSAADGGPWYAANADTSGGFWHFPVLDELFGRDPSGTGTVGPAPTGLAPDSTRDVQRDSSINRLETTSRIVTQQSASMHEQITRQVVVHDNVNAQGVEFVRPTADDYADDVVSMPLITNVRVDMNETWSTDKYSY